MKNFCYMPTFESPDRQQKETEEIDTSKSGERQRTILLVDDEKTNRRFLRLVLERYGFFCVEAESAEVAAHWLEMNPVDLIIVDIYEGKFEFKNGWRIPTPTGLEFLEKLMSLSTKNIPKTMVLSGALSSNLSFGVRARKAGALITLEKPCSLSVLLAAIMEACP